MLMEFLFEQVIIPRGSPKTLRPGGKTLCQGSKVNETTPTGAHRPSPIIVLIPEPGLHHQFHNFQTAGLAQIFSEAKFPRRQFFPTLASRCFQERNTCPAGCAEPVAAVRISTRSLLSTDFCCAFPTTAGARALLKLI
jgi:hypothetical protein